MNAGQLAASMWARGRLKGKSQPTAASGMPAMKLRSALSAAVRSMAPPGSAEIGRQLRICRPRSPARPSAIQARRPASEAPLKSRPKIRRSMTGASVESGIEELEGALQGGRAHRLTIAVEVLALNASVAPLAGKTEIDQAHRFA